MEFKITKAVWKEVDRLNEISRRSKTPWNYPEEWMRLWEDDLRLSKQDVETLHVCK